MNQEIEKLIDLGLADGKITEKERAVILKKAAELGLDMDETEMLIDARMHLFNKETIGTQIKCPSCGNKLSGLSKTCVCGYVLNTGTINESKSLEASIEILENLIVQVRGLSSRAPKESIELLIAKIDKEIRYIKTRYSENAQVRSLLNELETLSSQFIKKAKTASKRKKTITIIIYSFIILLISFFIYKKLTKKTAAENLSNSVIEAYLEPYLIYKTSPQYQIDSLKFYDLFIFSKLRYTGLTEQNIIDSIDNEWDKFESTLFPISEFKYYLKSSEKDLQGDQVSSKKLIDTAIILNSKFSPLYYRLAFLTDNLDSSIKYLSNAIALEGKNGYIYLPYRSQIFRDKYEDKKAIEDLNVYLNSYPKYLPFDLQRHIQKLAYMYDAGLKDASCIEYNKLSADQKNIMKIKLIDTYNLFEGKCHQNN